MTRSLGALLGLVSLIGCTVTNDDGSDTNPFGTTAPTSTATDDGTGPGSDAGTTAGDGSASGTPTTGTPTTGTPDDTSSSGSPPPTSDGPSDSSGNPGDGQLGDCIGTGAWTSCAMYCQANLDVCVEGGCGGATVVYYKDAGDCSAEQADSSAATPCAEPFAMGGGISFARCCCA